MDASIIREIHNIVMYLVDRNEHIDNLTEDEYLRIFNIIYNELKIKFR